MSISGVQAPGGGGPMNNMLPGILLAALLSHFASKQQGPAPKDGSKSGNLAAAAPQVAQAAQAPTPPASPAAGQPPAAGQQPQGDPQQALMQLKQVMSGQPGTNPAQPGQSQNSILQSLGLHIA